MFLWLLFAMHALALEVSELTDPRPKSQVVDRADVILGWRERKINMMLSDIKERTGVEVMVVTVPNTSVSPKEFAVNLGNTWGVGDAELDNGLIILLAMEQRRIEMEQGVGMEELLPASWLKKMQGSYMVPRFKKGDFQGGLVAGVEQVQLRLMTGMGESIRQNVFHPDVDKTQRAINKQKERGRAPPATAPEPELKLTGVEITILGLIGLLGLGIFGFIIFVLVDQHLRHSQDSRSGRSYGSSTSDSTSSSYSSSSSFSSRSSHSFSSSHSS